MPLFDLKCSKCGTVQIDVIIGINGDAKECVCANPSCQLIGTMEKLPSRVSMNFRGKGWTQTKRLMTPRESVESSLKWPK